MTRRRISAFASLTVMSFVLTPMISSMPAFAQSSGTQAQQDACTPDVFSLCQDFIPNEGPIVACLQAKRRQLSAACALVMFPQASAPKRAGGKRHHRHAHAK